MQRFFTRSHKRKSCQEHFSAFLLSNSFVCIYFLFTGPQCILSHFIFRRRTALSQLLQTFITPYFFRFPLKLGGGGQILWWAGILVGMSGYMWVGMVLSLKSGWEFICPILSYPLVVRTHQVLMKPTLSVRQSVCLSVTKILILSIISFFWFFATS